MIRVSLSNVQPKPPQQLTIFAEGSESYLLFDLLSKVVNDSTFRPEERKLANQIVDRINDCAKRLGAHCT